MTCRNVPGLIQAKICDMLSVTKENHFDSFISLYKQANVMFTVMKLQWMSTWGKTLTAH